MDCTHRKGAGIASAITDNAHAAKDESIFDPIRCGAKQKDGGYLTTDAKAV
jgi:hypothetical protein